jgi:hypothetical protein
VKQRFSNFPTGHGRRSCSIAARRATQTRAARRRLEKIVRPARNTSAGAAGSGIKVTPASEELITVL